MSSLLLSFSPPLSYTIYTDYTGILWDVTYCHWRIGDTPSICIANRGKSAGHVFPAKTSSFPLSCGLGRPGLYLWLTLWLPIKLTRIRYFEYSKSMTEWMYSFYYISIIITDIYIRSRINAKRSKEAMVKYRYVITFARQFTVNVTVYLSK